MNDLIGRSTLTAERVRSILHYEPSTGVMTWVAPTKYHPRMLGKVAGSRRANKGKVYIHIKIDGVAYSLGRLAFLWMTGRWPKEMIDHKSGDSLDNRWENLREATCTENAWNHKTRARRLQLPMGVRIVGNKFQARICKNKVMHYLGIFEYVNQAKAAYDSKRKEMFGEFA